MSTFTVDDTYGTLVYGSGWGISSTNDPSLAQYFQSTYHASQSPGAAVNFTFQGTGISLYGSKGPAHASYSVRCDSTVQLLYANASQPQYRQLLFSSQLPSGTHSLTLTNMDGLWLDLDSVTLTGDTNVTLTTTAFSSTITNPVLPTSSSSDNLPPSTSSTASSSLSNTDSTIHTVTFALAIAFGILFFCAITIGVWLFLNHRYRNLRRSVHRPPPPAVEMRLPGSAFLKPQDITPTPSSPPSTQDPSPFPRNLPPFPRDPAFPRDPSFPGHGAPEDAMSDVDGASHPFRSSVAPRPWSPFSGPLKHVFGNAKADGTDSMKSTFLKV